VRQCGLVGFQQIATAEPEGLIATINTTILRKVNKY
jgi:hypothetical protein